MTIYDTIKELLNGEIEARERRFKDQYLASIIAPKYAQGMFFPQDRLVDFAKDFESYNRIWRQVLQENEHLRGKDYRDKDAYEQDKIISMGYEIGYPKIKL